MDRRIFWPLVLVFNGVLLWLIFINLADSGVERFEAANAQLNAGIGETVPAGAVPAQADYTPWLFLALALGNGLFLLLGRRGRSPTAPDPDPR